MKYWCEGDLLYYDVEYLGIRPQWVGFYSPITNVELIDGVFHVKTEIGEYELYNVNDPGKTFVQDVSGVSIFELSERI